MAGLILRLAGSLLVFGAFFGGGILCWQRCRARWLQTHRFVLLLERLLRAIRYRALPGEELLRAVAREADFSGLGLEGCRTLAELPLPASLDKTLAAEVQEGLRAVAGAPHAAACQLLEGLVEACRRAEAGQSAAAQEAGRLYPKLGACLGVLAVILLQ